MKQSIIILFGLAITVFTTNTATALNICKKRGSYVGVLKKSINGTNPVVNNTDKTWSVTFDYTAVNGNANKLITGLAACNEVAGTVNVATTNLKTTASDVGPNCWCQMWPVSAYNKYSGISSWWVLQSVMADAATCASSCTAACANSMANNTNGFRSAVFESVK